MLISAAYTLQILTHFAQYGSNLRFPLVSLRTITASSEIPRRGAVNLSLPHRESASSNPSSRRVWEGWGRRGRSEGCYKQWTGRKHTKAQPAPGQTKMYWKWRKTAALRPLKDLRLNCYVRAALNKSRTSTSSSSRSSHSRTARRRRRSWTRSWSHPRCEMEALYEQPKLKRTKEEKLIHSVIHSCIQHCCTHHAPHHSLSLSIPLSAAFRTGVTACSAGVLCSHNVSPGRS